MLDLMDQINANYAHLTPSSRKIANYIRDNYMQAQYLSISGLANECGVAEATIFRFCKTLGFGGYNEFKLALAKSSIANQNDAYSAYGEIDLEDSTVESMCRRLYSANIQALSQTLTLLDESALIKAGDLLTSASKILGLGYGGSMATVREAWTRFLTVTSKFFTIEDNHMQIMAASLMEENDVILFISYSGSIRDAEDVLRPAKARGAKVILITHYADSPAAALSDVVLLCGGHEGPLQSGSIAAKMAMLFVVDMLVNEFCRRDMDTTMHNKDLTANALASRHI